MANAQKRQAATSPTSQEVSFSLRRTAVYISCVQYTEQLTVLIGRKEALALSFDIFSSKIFYNCFKPYMIKVYVMAEKEYKEKVKIDDDEAKIERESKDSFGNKVKEKHEIKED